MKIFYWCPFIGNVATIDAVINSIDSINKYSKKLFDPYLLNTAGEWEPKNKLLNEKKIKTINFYNKNVMQYLPKLGFLKSRFTYIIIFFLTVAKLHKVLKQEKPDYLVIHLITFIPLFLILFFNYKTKFILRISGYPKLNIFRKIFWKILGKKIFIVTTPTLSTMKLLNSQNIFPRDKIKYLPDPVLKISEIQKKRNESNIVEKYISKENSLISIGRLTKQKNFTFLINVFYEIQKKYENFNLIILGEGEERKILEKKINELNLSNKIFLIGYKKNIYDYLKESRIFIQTSLWEDPGFVLLEAGYSNKIVLSSNCPNGPIEILDNGNNGFLYKLNSIKDFMQNFEKIINSNEATLLKKKIMLKKKCKEFTLFNHFNKFKDILE